MSWREQLRPGSFRGAAFEIMTGDLDTGRKGAHHEYPQRDESLFEDLGKKTRKLSVVGFVLGDDYMARRDALIDACEAKGPGTLIHPYFGSLQVSCTEIRSSEQVTEGRMARITMVFVQTATVALPKTVSNTAAKVSTSAESVISASRDVFAAKYSVENLPQFVADSVTTTATEFGDSVRSGVRSPDIEEAVQSFTDALPSTVNSGEELGGAIIDLLQSAASISGDAPAVMASLSSFNVDVSGIPVSTTTRIQQVKNLTAYSQLVRIVAISNEAVALSKTRFDSYEDAITRMRSISERIDAELLTANV
jgi:prophage DNA circulation protein